MLLYNSLWTGSSTLPHLHKIMKDRFIARNEPSRFVIDLVTWIKNHFTRKFTVPFHVIGGAVCAELITIYPPLGLTLFISFGLFEFWQGIVEGDFGHLDFWDFMFGAFIVATVLVIKFLI